jgi:phosphoglucosamine mutase
MEPRVLKRIIAENTPLITDLAEKKMFIVDSLETGNILSETADASLFPAHADVESAMEKLIQTDFYMKYGTPVLIDFKKALSLYLSATGKDDGENIHTALMMSRVNFMGTDGIRGKVVCNPGKDFITALLEDNAFTPDLVRITSFSFAVILKRNEIAAVGDTFFIGNDGRDSAYDWKLNAAVCDGFNRAGLEVVDLGVVPTAIIPWQMLKHSARGGACLTASHNPSNQNGIKFFIDGAKLLPEGDLGDYTLSAYMYNFCRVEDLPEAQSMVETRDVEEEARDFLMDVLPDNMKDLLRDTTLVFDSANGATHSMGLRILDTLGVSYTSKNETPSGDNINRACGVAEIEGTEFFAGSDYDAHIPFVQEIFDRGRAQSSNTVWGIPLDGDGDRGFLLYYDKDVDGVHVLDGDKCGYILSRYFIEENNLTPSDYWFISTIESDIMTASAAEKNLGLNTKVVAVGDKWIGNFTEGKILVGLEISGHLIFPIPVTDAQGKNRELLSGVGILTGLLSLAAVKSLHLSREEIIHPFEPGFSETKYTYFVDKALHYRGSRIWKEDKRIVETHIARLVKNGDLPEETVVEYEEKEDVNVLYMNIMNNSELLGVIFMRNSGTEDKNAVYVKGQEAYQRVLTEIGTAVQKMHMKEMKNKNRIEYTCEKVINENLDGAGSTDVDTVLNTLNNDGHDVSETDLFAVLHGLKKEGVLRVNGRGIVKGA